MKLFKNKFFIGVLCIAAALLFSFVAVPALQGSSQNPYVNAVRMKAAVQDGAQISAEMVETVRIPEGLVQGSISDVSSVLGRYANTDLYTGDYLTAEKLFAKQEKTDTVAAGTSKGKMVMPVTLPSLASGVSGQLQPGDVVTVMSLPNGVVNKTLGIEPETTDTVSNSGAVIYPELQYLEVCMVTANDGSNTQYAFKTGLIDFNPADRVERPRKGKYTASIYNAKELETLFAVVKGKKIELAVILGAFYGLRRSEVVGLKWDAIDFERKTLTIKHTVTEVTLDGKNTIIEKDRTKTKSSYRSLPLVEPFEELLNKLGLNRSEIGKCAAAFIARTIWIISMWTSWANGLSRGISRRTLKSLLRIMV